jgi:23S rRNA pseudouridine1911/1915/1917 synthase
MQIIYEDKDVLVINKPAGINVHTGVKTGETISDWFVKRYPESKNVGAVGRAGIVHRLDKETSGVLILAKTQKALEWLKKQFKARETKKFYLALVHGQVERAEGLIDLPIGRSPKNRLRRTTQLRSNSRSALTEFKIIKQFKEYTLVETRPFTGRTHQIRVHMAAINHPVVGDKLYMSKPYRKKDKNIPRLFLHAKKLKITLPSGKKETFEEPLPLDLEAFLKRLD